MKIMNIMNIIKGFYISPIKNITNKGITVPISGGGKA
jgi:hypothetical protein